MTNDFKMIVFKQLTISIKTQYDNKINVSCSANQQNVTLVWLYRYMLNMTIMPQIGTLNLSTLFSALFVFSAFIETLDFFFSQEMRPPFSIPCWMQSALRLFTFYAIFTSCIATERPPSDITYLPAGSMGFVPTGHRPIKSRHFYQAGDNMLCW